MSAIGPGDWVECIDASPNPHLPGPPSLVLGALYQVEDVDVNRWGEIGLILCGRRSLVGYRGGYSADRFRPIYRPKSEIIESLKQPAPERELEDA